MKESQVKYLDADGKKHNLEGVKIIAGLCTLDGFPKAFVDYLLKTALCNVFESVCTIESALLPMARNQVISLVYANNPDFSHILFIDSDMTEFCAEHLVKLVLADKPIISGACTLRNPPYTLVNPFLGDVDDATVMEYMRAGEIRECAVLGMAFTLIKKEVFDAVQEETAQGPIWFNMDRQERAGFDAEIEEFLDEVNEKTEKEYHMGGCGPEYMDPLIRKAIAMGQLSHIGSPILGEDITFTRQARKLGFKCFTHCDVIIGHLGTQAYNFAHTLAHNNQIVSA